MMDREKVCIFCNIATKETAPNLIKSSEFIAETLPSAAEAKSSSQKHFVDGRGVVGNM